MGYANFKFEMFEGTDYSLLKKEVNEFLASKKLIYCATQMVVVYDNRIVISVTYEEELEDY